MIHSALPDHYVPKLLLIHPLGVLFSVVVIILLAGGFILSSSYGPLSDTFSSLLRPCIFKSICHIPCPTCGSGRAIMSLSHFHMKDAFFLNPLVTSGFLSILLWGLISTVGVLLNRQWSIDLNSSRLRLLRCLFALLIALNWIYLIIFDV